MPRTARSAATACCACVSTVVLKSRTNETKAEEYGREKRPFSPPQKGVSPKKNLYKVLRKESFPCVRVCAPTGDDTRRRGVAAALERARRRRDGQRHLGLLRALDLHGARQARVWRTRTSAEDARLGRASPCSFQKPDPSECQKRERERERRRSRSGYYERARKRYKLKTGIELFNWSFYKERPLDSQAALLRIF